MGQGCGRSDPSSGRGQAMRTRDPASQLQHTVERADGAVPQSPGSRSVRERSPAPVTCLNSPRWPPWPGPASCRLRPNTSVTGRRFGAVQIKPGSHGALSDKRTQTGQSHPVRHPGTAHGKPDASIAGRKTDDASA